METLPSYIQGSKHFLLLLQSLLPLPDVNPEVTSLCTNVTHESLLTTPQNPSSTPVTPFSTNLPENQLLEKSMVTSYSLKGRYFSQ